MKNSLSRIRHCLAVVVVLFFVVVVIVFRGLVKYKRFLTLYSERVTTSFVSLSVRMTESDQPRTRSPQKRNPGNEGNVQRASKQAVLQQDAYHKALR